MSGPTDEDGTQYERAIDDPVAETLCGPDSGGDVPREVRHRLPLATPGVYLIRPHTAGILTRGR